MTVFTEQDGAIEGSTDQLVGGLSLSQSSLQTLTTCPRKFQYLYLDQLGLPHFQFQGATDLSVDLPQDLGTWFHRLLQQQELGLDIQPLLTANAPLPDWFATFQATPPPMIAGVRASEQRYQSQMGNLGLVGIYDLVIFGTDQAQILDWKTYQRPQTSEFLKHHWQTRLYPYLLAATGEFAPEQILMTYWFALAPDDQHSLTFRYSQALFEKTQQQLSQLSQRIEAWITNYAQGQPLPQVTLESGKCFHCEFAYRCQRPQSLRFEDESEADELNPQLLLDSVMNYPELAIQASKPV